MGGGQKFIAVTCHDDVEQWLMPDWTFNTDTMTFTTNDLAEQKKNRPKINLEIYETSRKREYWEAFRKYHYLNHSINVAAHCYICFANGKLAGFSSIMPQPHPLRKRLWRIHRTVVLPDFQGIGIAKEMQNAIAVDFRRRGYDVSIVTSNRAMIQSMRGSDKWICTAIGRKVTRSGAISLPHQSGKRITASFEFIADGTD